MGRKCCVSKCKQGYVRVPKDPNVTFHLFKEEWRLKIHRGSKWKVAENTYICSKHFVASDFIIESRDSNRRRRKKKGTKLKYRFLKDGVCPTIFPNCPSYLSGKKTAERPTRASSSSARKELIEKRVEDKKLRDLKLDSVKTLSDIEAKLKNPVLFVNNPSSLKDVSFKTKQSKIYVYMKLTMIST